MDAVRLAKAIQLVEPDRPLAQPVSEVLEEELEPTRRVELDEACRLGPVFHIVWGIRRGFSTQQPGVGLTTSSPTRACIAPSRM
jgi:hypothetical protein